MTTVIGGTVIFSLTAANTTDTDLPFDLTKPLAGILDDATVSGEPRVQLG